MRLLTAFVLLAIAAAAAAEYTGPERNPKIALSHNAYAAQGFNVPKMDLSEALKYVYYSYAAYCDSDRVMSWNCNYCRRLPGFKPIAAIEDTDEDLFAFVGYSLANKTVVVSFRGTVSDSFSNWLTDLHYSHTQAFPSIPNAQVHAGFLNAYTALRYRVRTSVERAFRQCPSCDKIAITGHSLGAAISSLCAIDLRMNMTEIVGRKTFLLYNYGMPRVGNDYFADFFHGMFATQDAANPIYGRSGHGVLWRVVNEDDVVPHVPPKMLGFKHPPREVWRTASGSQVTYTNCDATGEDETCSNDIFSNSIAAHSWYMGVPSSLAC